ncbi:hypothetical protein [Bacillus sp. V5-8f]|uniref:hypothetical protein n=1 Tax=Bacillus sp. V5-8f TaxID=2053044 RepID=UPI000C761FA6|nr:hypothetical protein [Bacillus sp. V5-8f]PLT33721.1 hypothetical protein CUU64_11430 [Bacillus sp. V5-8f]
MYEIISSDIKIDKKLSVQQMMALYQEVSSFDGNVYFLFKHKIIDAAKLSKLVSFMLTIEERTSIKVIIEGKKVQKMVSTVTKYCGGKLQKNYKLYMNPKDTIQI